MQRCPHDQKWKPEVISRDVIKVEFNRVDFVESRQSRPRGFGRVHTDNKVDRIGNKVERIRQQSTLLPIILLPVSTKSTVLNSTLSPVCTGLKSNNAILWRNVSAPKIIYFPIFRFPFLLDFGFALRCFSFLCFPFLRFPSILDPLLDQFESTFQWHEFDPRTTFRPKTAQPHVIPGG